MAQSESLARLLREARDARGLRAQWVAEQIGVHPATISRWEQGHAVPRAASIMALAELYGWGEGELLRVLRLAQRVRPEVTP